jgi:hypothetical protein
VAGGHKKNYFSILLQHKHQPSFLSNKLKKPNCVPGGFGSDNNATGIGSHHYRFNHLQFDQPCTEIRNNLIFVGLQRDDVSKSSAASATFRNCTYCLHYFKNGCNESTICLLSIAPPSAQLPNRPHDSPTS